MHNMTFNELWYSLSDENKALLKQKLKHRCNVGDSSVYMWANGTRTPKTANRRIICDVVRTTLNLRIPSSKLFPQA